MVKYQEKFKKEDVEKIQKHFTAWLKARRSMQENKDLDNPENLWISYEELKTKQIELEDENKRLVSVNMEFCQELSGVYEELQKLKPKHIEHPDEITCPICKQKFKEFVVFIRHWTLKHFAKYGSFNRNKDIMEDQMLSKDKIDLYFQSKRTKDAGARPILTRERLVKIKKSLSKKKETKKEEIPKPKSRRPNTIVVKER